MILEMDPINSFPRHVNTNHLMSYSFLKLELATYLQDILTKEKESCKLEEEI